MRDWLTYELSDLLLFSERVYWRLFELENAALWPMPLLAPFAIVGALILHIRHPEIGARLLLGFLALAWLWSGWHFILQRYAPVNWAMTYAGPAFALEAIILAGLAVRWPPRRINSLLARVVGYSLILAATLGYPGLATLQGRGIASAEIIAIAPDPTALATLGAAFFVADRWCRLAALALPSLWLAQSALTLYVLNGSAAIVPAIGLAIGVAGLLAPGGRPGATPR